MARNVAEALAPSSGGPALEVKGTITPVTVICLRSVDVTRIEKELRARVDPAPQLFLNAPVVIDVADVDPNAGPLPLAEIVARVRACRMVPIGVAHLAPEQVALAAEVGLAIVQLGFGKSRGARANSSSPVEPPVAAAPSAVRAVAPVAAPAPRATAAPAEPAAQSMTVSLPVRGGQVVYSHGDLVVCAPVNAGAQVIADGHIHIYGRLRGRALAGARGNAEARVFCQCLEPELIAVAGEFLTADDIPKELLGRPAQVYLENGAVKVGPL
ncbi:MAG TPA: septum site-determining protein MinC [Polyangia bacterium]|jgi:septum site-determining protein MinC|nr:septum site-determining protein MinC [Polyangia bacterium]